METLSDRLSRIAPSPTVVMTQRAAELRAEGVDVLSLSAGEPDFDTPPHIVQAAKEALDGGMTRYTAAPGIPELRQAVADQSASVRGVPCDPSRVIITVGAKHAIFEFFMAVLNPGDEVIIPAPFWVSYPDQVRLAGGVPVIAETSAEDSFTLTTETLDRLKTPRTKVVVLNTPNNPTGTVYTEAQVTALMTSAAADGIWVLTDEVYRDLVYDGEKSVSPLTVAPEQRRERVFVVDGVSKSFAMTGWRIGWGIGHPDVISGMTKLQGQSTTNATAVSQAAALTAITGPSDFMSDWNARYTERRDAIVDGLSRIDGVECRKPAGAFYVLPSVKGVLARLGEGTTDVALASRLLEESQVATVPGSAFGAPGHLRLSYATSLDIIKESVARMKRAIDSI
jgi:aspartate aminotransferase